MFNFVPLSKVHAVQLSERKHKNTNHPQQETEGKIKKSRGVSRRVGAGEEELKNGWLDGEESVPYLSINCRANRDSSSRE